ncbi:ATP-dependent DNA helicase Q4, partial [Actinomortierella ambigua]
MSPEYKSAVMRRFIEGDIKVLISTEAAGMGCDVKDVSRVVQFKVPKTMTMSTLVQRLGRAARNGVVKGEAIVLWTGKTEPECKDVQRLLSGKECLRAVISEHFNNPVDNSTNFTEQCCCFCHPPDHRQQQMHHHLHQKNQELGEVEVERADLDNEENIYNGRRGGNVQGRSQPVSQKVAYNFLGSRKDRRRQVKEALLRWRKHTCDTDLRLRIEWAVPELVLEDRLLNKAVSMILQGEPTESILSRLSAWGLRFMYGGRLRDFLGALQATSDTQGHPMQPGVVPSPPPDLRVPRRATRQRGIPRQLDHGEGSQQRGPSQYHVVEDVEPAVTFTRSLSDGYISDSGASSTSGSDSDFSEDEGDYYWSHGRYKAADDES